MNKAFFGFEKTYLPLLFLLAILCNFSQPISAQPQGFSDELVIDGWAQAVGITFDDNGRMYVWEKGGKVWTVENGVKSANPLVDISEEVGNWRDFGLVGFALDPNFLNNGYLYLWYVVDRHHLMNFGTTNYNANTSSEKEATIARLTRYKANIIDDFATIDYNSRKILIGETKATGPPILHESHGAGQIIFGSDGTLIVTVGDGASYANPVDEGSHPATYFQQALADGIITPAQNIGAYRCQSLNNLSGKILRINPNTGNGVPSNPYYQANNPRSPQSRIWSIGARNPYRIALRPETGSHNVNDGNPGTFFFGDVGWSTWEDLNVIDAPGQNFGWPIHEGLTLKPGYNNPNYAISAAEHERPKIDWRHGADQSRALINNTVTAIGNGTVAGQQFRGSSSTGGIWYIGNDFPAEYRNTYFHADYSTGWIRNFGFDKNNNPTFVKDFKLNAGAVVFLNTSPIADGLFYVRYPNQIRKIVYTGSANKKPIAILQADKTFGANPLSVQFNASQSFDPEYSNLSYNWNFGDGGTSTEINPIHIFHTNSTIPTTFSVKLSVTDQQGAWSQQKIPISLNNTPPIITSTSIDNTNFFNSKNGATLNLNAIVTDTEHNGQLKYEWQTALYHDGHSHAEPIDNNPSTTASLSALECDGSTYWFRITLKVTDPEGLFSSFQKDIFPDCNGLSQTINFPSIPNQSVTAGSFILDASTTSGLPVSAYLLEGPAVIFGNKVVLTGFPGKVSLRITQEGNEIYKPAIPVEQNFDVVIPASVTCTAEGRITRDIWSNGNLNSISNIPVSSSPNQSNLLDNFEVKPFTLSKNAQRIRGFICPPQTGLYTFWIASDGDSQLWLSTNINQKNRRLIANIMGSTRPNQWNKFSSQQSVPILLVAGSQYYIEGLTNRGGHLSAGWKMPDNSLNRPISGQYLSPWKDKQKQTISFFGISDKLTTDPAFVIGASSNSGLPVEFALMSGPATVSGTTVTLTGQTGIVVIQAHQTGNGQFNSAKSIERRFEVNAPPALPSISIDAPTNGGSISGTTLNIQYTLRGDLHFHNADHLLISLDNQTAIDVHTLNGRYSLENVKQGVHTLKIQIADSNHKPFSNAPATAIINFSMAPNLKAQIISFPSISNKKTTDRSFAISAYASSGLPVNLSILSGAASINGNTISLIGQAGQIVVRASQNGNGQFKPANSVDRSFNVLETSIEKLNQNINFPSIPNKLTTDQPFEVIATASSGLPVSFAIERGPASINGNIITLNGIPGTVIIRASQNGNTQYNRSISFGRSFIVSQSEKSNQLISFPAISNKLSTDAAFSIDVTSSSGLPVSLSILSGPATIIGNQITLNGSPGKVMVRANQSGNAQYNSAPNVNRPFEIAQPNTVTENTMDYCSMKSDFPWEEWIGQVIFGDLNNLSSKDIYKHYSNQKPAFNIGEDYTLKIIPAFSWTQWDEYIKVWIDFNIDGDFEDNGEEVLAAINLAGNPQSIVKGVSNFISIPSNALEGATRMRVAMQREGYASSCETIKQGEIEDYTIIIGNAATTIEMEDEEITNTDYCNSKGRSPWQEWIGNVSFGNINNNSSKEGYADFTNQSTTVYKGSSYSISVSPSFSWEQWNEYISVWFDFNQNGNFDDIGEQVLSGISIASAAQSSPQTVSGTVSIPNNAKEGITRMRVAMQQKKYAANCEDFEFGEVEDYSINITASSSNRVAQILTFSAYINKQKVELEWLSNGDWKAKKYKIERSEDNLKFYTIQEILIENDEPKAKYYFSADDEPIKGISFYRIKQINKDGSFKYSNASQVQRAFGADEFYLFPNPVKEIINLNLKPFIGKSVDIKIYNPYGQLVKKRTIEKVQTALVSFNLNEEQNGIYYLSIKADGMRIIGKKFILSKMY